MSSARTASLSGFTLIEVMVSGALLAVGLAAVLSAIGTTTGLMAHQRHMTQAIHVAEAVMESQLVKISSHATLTQGAHVGPSFNAKALQDPSGIYTTAWTVQEASPLPTLRTITVTVTWPEESGPRSISYTTVRK